jgi:ubiquitin-protein ligase E3 C
LALNDDEFFDRAMPLSLEAQAELVAALSAHLLEALWDAPVMESRASGGGAGGGGGIGGGSSGSGGGGGGIEAVQLALAQTRLFNQLYDRHSRRDFMGGLSRAAFLWKDFRAAELEDAVGLSGVFGSRRLAMVLTCLPQVLHFKQRVHIFQQLVEADKERSGQTEHFNGQSTDVRVSRETLYEDSMEQLDQLGPALKGRVRVQFTASDGHAEAGIDGGGLYRDFMNQLCERAFDPLTGFFRAGSDHLLSPSPASAEVKGHLRHFEFMGRILGKAVYSRILVKPQFAICFLNKLLDRPNVIDDLYSLDPEVYRNLMALKGIARGGGNLEDLTLSFTSTTASASGRPRQVELVPGGADLTVNNVNFQEYQFRLANFKLNQETAQQARAFLRGFRDLIPVDWIRMFDARELQMIIGGEQRGIDLDNLKQFTHYGGGADR